MRCWLGGSEKVFDSIGKGRGKRVWVRMEWARALGLQDALRVHEAQGGRENTE
jgi:hypothetical protein